MSEAAMRIGIVLGPTGQTVSDRPEFTHAIGDWRAGEEHFACGMNPGN